MRILLLSVLLCIGCNETGKSQDASTPAAVIKQLDQYGCSAFTNGDGSVHVSCKDGTAADIPKGPKGDAGAAGPAGNPGYFNIQESNGVNHTNLIHLCHDGHSHWIWNKTSGNILTYNVQGQLATSGPAYFISSDCSGTPYLSTSSLLVYFAGVAVQNNANYGSSTGFKYGSKLSGTINSYWDGSCHSGPVGGTFSQALAINLDSTDLVQLNIPVQLTQSQ